MRNKYTDHSADRQDEIEKSYGPTPTYDGSYTYRERDLFKKSYILYDNTNLNNTGVHIIGNTVAEKKENAIRLMLITRHRLTNGAIDDNEKFRNLHLYLAARHAHSVL